MRWLKRLLALVAFGIVLYLFWPLVGELRAVADLLRQARWAWLVAAVVIHIISYISLTALNYLLLQPFGGQISFMRLMAILPTMAFIEVAIPSAGVSSVVLRARFLGRSGYSVEASTFTLAIESIYLAVAMAAVSLSGLWYLIRSGEVGTRQLALLGGLATVLLAVGVLIIRYGRDREWMKRWADRVVAGWNRLAPRLHQPAAALDHFLARVDAFYDGLAQLRQTPRWPYWIAAISRVALDVATLYACFAAFRYAISPGVLLTGYGLMLLLSSLAALPGGLGLADASLAVVYDRLGTPGAVAVAASLTYRLITFWLLRFIGFICWQLLEAQKRDNLPEV